MSERIYFATLYLLAAIGCLQVSAWADRGFEWLRRKRAEPRGKER